VSNDSKINETMPLTILVRQNFFKTPYSFVISLNRPVEVENVRLTNQVEMALLTCNILRQ
jgi:uncharacterized protein YueI